MVGSQKYLSGCPKYSKLHYTRNPNWDYNFDSLLYGLIPYKGPFDDF